MSIPNYKHIVEDMAARYPAAWAAAHRGGPDTEDFIRLLAWRLHELDPRFGLTGKRGAPHDLSDDAICFDGVAAGGDYDPTRHNAPVTVIDVIAAAGGPNPQPAWIYPLTPAAAAWVAPSIVVPEPPEPTPGPPVPNPGTPCGYDTALRGEVAALRADVAALAALVGALSDEIMAQRQALAATHTAVEDVRLALRNGLHVTGTGTGLRWVGTLALDAVAKG